MASKLHQGPPFRAEHMGSLLRPQVLLDVRATIRDKGVSPESADLPAVEASAVENVIKLQTELGLRAVTSGEFVRTRFWGEMWDQFGGTLRLEDADASMFRLYHPDVVSLIEKDRKVMPGDSVIAGAKLFHDPDTSVANLHELKLVQKYLPKEKWGDIKLTVITPAWFHMRYKQGKAWSKGVYGSDKEYFADVAKVYQEELAMLYAAGLRNVQFDDPGMAYFCSKSFRQGWEEDKDNDGTVEDLLDAYISLYNDSISKLPADFHTGIHLCRGNFIGGRHFAEGSYDIIAKKLFQNLKVNTFYLEYDTERAGGFEPLQFLPKDKNVVLGIISTKLKALEDKEEMKKRVQKAAEFVAKGSGQSTEESLERIQVSPQCGFSTHEEGYPLSEDDEKAKLGLIRQIADEIWGEP
ncbi:5-methyltetrahydropteroyltriglutamate-homocysteine methyltransferase [Microthyrium microscopicum]|uniref:5-methyltetrahydropteroyltriglutamate-homocysteine methyltransferase n=1 Tax=Microthyrium microscopicum TaxID=703497 RepID=A0A6A6U4P9_9PEZI|nr:5-methyltetrahydropteroyltriglutamate-homocysteine methyltransferase [Microthyrium microscopicum]